MQWLPINRPPFESDSLLLPITTGCSYAGCTFCREHVLARFCVHSVEKILADLQRLTAEVEPEECASLFLAGENGLCLPTEDLLKILSAVQQALPNLEHIGIYGRGDDILGKTPMELLALAEAGLTTVYMGVESGSEQVLALCNKGENTALLMQALNALENCGIEYSLSSIIGLGGRALCTEHATQTAKFYNRVRPSSIRLLTLSPIPGSVLYQQIQAGTFSMLSPQELVLETRLLLECLDTECFLLGDNVSNPIPFAGHWPRDRERICTILDQGLACGLPETRYAPEQL